MKKVIKLGFLWLLAVIGSASGAQAITEEQLCELYIGVVEDAVTEFEPLWVDESERIPNSGFFDFRKYGDWVQDYQGYAGIVTVPGNGMITFCYSILLTETDKKYFTKQRIPRSVILDHAIKSIRWCCLTSAYVKEPYPYIHEDTHPLFLEGRHWKRRVGYQADEVGWLTLAAAKMWPMLDEESKRLVEDVMIEGAAKERTVRRWVVPQGGNHDQVKQDMSSTMGAAFMFPQRSDAYLYQNVIRGSGIDMVSTLHDRALDVLADGKKIKHWAWGWNLYQDYSSDHHGWAQIWYGSDMIFEGRLYVEILSKIMRTSVPETFRYDGNGFDGVLEWVKRLFLTEGEPVSVHGMEYDGYYGAGLLAYCYGAVLKKDPVSAAFEERAANLLARHSRAIGVYDYHRNSWGKAGIAYLVHKYCGGRAGPMPFDQAWRRLEGVYHHRWQQNLIHRSRDKLSSFSWGAISSYGRHLGGGDNGVCGFVVPTNFNTAEPVPLIYLHPHSVVGKVTATPVKGKSKIGPYAADLYRFSWDDGGFCSAGVIQTPPVQQFCAFFSFDQGPCVFFNRFTALESCRLDWSGVPMYFYVRERLTGSRVYYDAQGQQPLEREGKRRSTWWCVDDAIGIAVVGGIKQIEIERSVGRNWARMDAYKDKCDGVYISPINNCGLKPEESCGDVAVAIYANTPHKGVAQAGEKLEHAALQLPKGWKGVVIPDGTSRGKRYLALANFRGEQTQTVLDLMFPEGAPILSEQTVIVGKKGRTTVRLDRLESFAQTLELYIKCVKGTGVNARRETGNRFVIWPLDEEKTEVRVRYCGTRAEEVEVSSLTDLSEKQIPIGGFIEKNGAVLDVRSGIRIDLKGKAYQDNVAPAVEIEDIAIREDGRVTVNVEAHDKSNIRSVSLYCDGQLIGEKSLRPYFWNCWLRSGYHSFYAVARDDSIAENERKSFLRTVEIPLHS